jgi:hypothetical protein
MKFLIDIENSAGTKQGGGPIISASSWESVARLDQAGTFSFPMPASDPKATLATAKRIARCRGLINTAVTDIRAGIIDKIKVGLDSEGKAELTISGDDLLRELTYKRVGNLTIGTPGTPPTTSNTGPSDIIALAPAGWSLEADHAKDGHLTSLKAVFHQFEGETVLEAFVKLAELTGEHFRLGDGRKVVWMQDHQTSSGVRAIQGGDPLSLEDNNDICLILSLNEEQDSYECYIGHVYAWGAGEGAARITLNGAAAPPAGYLISHDSKGYYLEHTATWTAYGIESYQSWKDVKDPDSLREMAYEWLKRRISAGKTYRMSVTQLNKAVSVGGTIFVVYKRVVDGYVEVDIHSNLVVLESNIRLDENGLRTVDMELGTIDRWPDSDSLQMVGGLGMGITFASHAQPLNGADITGTIPPGTHTHPHTDITDWYTAAPILARYSTDAGQSIPDTTVTIVDFEDVTYDPDSLVTIGAAWHFTAVTAGYYGISAIILFAATTTWADAEAGSLDLYKNGALFSHLDRKDSYGSASSVYMALGGDDLVYLAVGDILDIRVNQISGAALALHNNGVWNHVAIWKI